MIKNKVSLLLVMVPAILLSLAFLNLGENFKRIQLYVDGEKMNTVTSKKTVETLLEELHIVLTPGDDIHPSLKALTLDKQVILLTRENSPLYAMRSEQPIMVGTFTRFEEEKVTIPYTSVKKKDRRLARGRKRRLVKGKDGLALVRYKVIFANGQKTKRRIVSQKVLTPPKNEVVLIGTGSNLYASRTTVSRLGARNDATGNNVAGTSMSMVATAYWRLVGGTGITSTGRKAGYGIVAVDPRVIPLGTRVYVNGYGYAVAADTGKAIKGKRIDLCFNTHAEAKRFGRRTVTVKLIR